MKIVHVCDGWEKWNGAANIARLIVGEQSAAGHEVSLCRFAKIFELRSAGEVWIHCGWKSCLWWAAFWAKKAYWMPEACYDPVRLNYHGWKKRIVGPIERWSLRRCKKLVATCEAEKKWIQAYVRKGCPEVVVEDIKRFFALNKAKSTRTIEQREIAEDLREQRNLHILYLGRRHPLKGVEFLERAVIELNHHCTPTPMTYASFSLRIVSDHFGEELEKDWQWCDVLVLPTLSDNFGLVIAEALERGKSVITTDGAPAWEPPEAAESKLEVEVEQWRDRIIYLKGYLDGTDEERVRLLKDAIMGFAD